MQWVKLLSVISASHISTGWSLPSEYLIHFPVRTPAKMAEDGPSAQVLATYPGELDLQFWPPGFGQNCWHLGEQVDKRIASVLLLLSFSLILSFKEINKMCEFNENEIN